VISEAETFTGGSQPRLVCPNGMEGCLGKHCLQQLMDSSSYAPLARNLAAEAPSTLGFAFAVGARIMERDSRGHTSTQRDSGWSHDQSGSLWSTRARPSSDSPHQRMSKQATVIRCSVSQTKATWIEFRAPSIAMSRKGGRHFQTASKLTAAESRTSLASERSLGLSKA
jgi:hypothetical protein